MPRLIAELGSCHMGKYAYICDLLDECRNEGITEAKVQLFPNIEPYVPTNCWLDPKDFLDARILARQFGIELSASVFDEESFAFLFNLRPKWIKFAFSKKEQTKWIQQTLDAGMEAIVSSDVMTLPLVPAGATNLYCVPEYPVKSWLHFDTLFTKFDGFSDHTLGLNQTKLALDAGSKIIEKHVRLGKSYETCPDAQFAVTIKQFASLNNYKTPGTNLL